MSIARDLLFKIEDALKSKDKDSLSGVIDRLDAAIWVENDKYIKLLVDIQNIKDSQERAVIVYSKAILKRAFGNYGGIQIHSSIDQLEIALYGIGIKLEELRSICDRQKSSIDSLQASAMALRDFHRKLQ